MSTKAQQYQHIAVMLVGIGVLFCVMAPSASANSRAVRKIERTYFDQSVTVADLRQEYTDYKTGKTDRPVRILISPGHEPSYGGAVWNGLYERDMNLELAYELRSLLKEDGFDVVMTRYQSGWRSSLAEFFDTQEKKTRQFIEDHKEATANLLEDEDLVFDNGHIMHGNAAADVAYRLYAINRWTDTQNIDLAIHIHFNDTASRNLVTKDPSGFSMYVPDKNFSNGPASYAIAESIFERLAPWYAVSNNRQEKEGIIPNSKLIALGAYNTLDTPAILMEYGYIYETRFQDPVIRILLQKELALQTYLGVKDFFAGYEPHESIRESLLYTLIPADTGTLEESKTPSFHVLGLQARLLAAGVYPVQEQDLRSCPLDGIFGQCTAAAVELFQESRELEQDGTVGPTTLGALLSESVRPFRVPLMVYTVEGE